MYVSPRPRRATPGDCAARAAARPDLRRLRRLRRRRPARHSPPSPGLTSPPPPLPPPETPRSTPSPAFAAATAQTPHTHTHTRAHASLHLASPFSSPALQWGCEFVWIPHPRHFTAFSSRSLTPPQPGVRPCPTSPPSFLFIHIYLESARSIPRSLRPLPSSRRPSLPPSLRIPALSPEWRVGGSTAGQA